MKFLGLEAIGRMYKTGRGFGKCCFEEALEEESHLWAKSNYVKAKEYFEESAELGNAEAHYELGILWTRS